MTTITKTIEEWQDFLEAYKQFRKNWGYKKIEEVRSNLEQLANTRKLIDTFDFEVIKFFQDHHITDIAEIIGLLAKLNNYRDFKIFKDLVLLKEYYKIEDIALIISDEVPVLDVYLGYSDSKIAFFPKGIYPWWKINFKKERMEFSLLPWAYYQFIVAKFSKGECKRTLYTSTFHFVSETFPSQKEMEQVDLDKYRLEWFDWLLYYLLEEFKGGELTFLIDELEEYQVEALIAKETYRVILSDGDNNGITIKRANVVWDSVIEGAEIKSLRLSINPMFLEKYREFIHNSQDKRKKGLLEELMGVPRRRKKENF